MKINPGQLVMYISIVFAIFAIVFATMFNRLDSIVLAMGVGLVGYGAGLELPMSLLLASMSAFLGAYLPFGLSSKAEIAGFSEGFEDEDFDDEGFACKSKRGEEGFKSGGSRNDEDFDDEGFQSGGKRRDDEDFDDEGFKNSGKRRDDEDFDDEGFQSGGKRRDDEDFDDEGFQSGGKRRDDEDFDDEGFDTDHEGFANPDGKKKLEKRSDLPQITQTTKVCSN